MGEPATKKSKIDDANGEEKVSAQDSLSQPGSQHPLKDVNVQLLCIMTSGGSTEYVDGILSQTHNHLAGGFRSRDAEGLGGDRRLPERDRLAQREGERGDSQSRAEIQSTAQAILRQSIHAHQEDSKLLGHRGEHIGTEYCPIEDGQVDKIS